MCVCHPGIIKQASVTTGALSVQCVYGSAYTFNYFLDTVSTSNFKERLVKQLQCCAVCLIKSVFIISFNIFSAVYFCRTE